MDFAKATAFIYENARMLERAVFEYHFFNGPAGRVIDALRVYQNVDGGFGHALEPDVRAPDSQPLFVEFALSTLRQSGLHDVQMAVRACDFLARHANLEHGIPVLFPSYLDYPRAEHWNTPMATQPSLDRLIGLVGMVRWQGVRQLWLDQAVESCLEKISAIHFTDAHTILPAFTLLESLSAERDVESLFQKLAGELDAARFFHASAPVTGYGLTPLNFAPAPDAYCRRFFRQDQIEAHLADLASRQAADGGWPIQWGPPPGAAEWEWRAHMTVYALVVLKAYGRI
jgi:hypothetical protein